MNYRESRVFHFVYQKVTKMLVEREVGLPTIVGTWRNLFVNK